MKFGLVQPSAAGGASVAGIEAAAAAAERLGWSSVWVNDHVIVDHRAAGEYGHIFEALTTLAYVAGRTANVRLGTSVLVVAQRNAVLLAKELASLDALARGRVIVGVGVGWNRAEFGNLGAGDRFAERAAYTEETVQLWRHLWAGRKDPFHGRFHVLEDFEFSPLPDQRESLPIWMGGFRPPVLRRAGRLADGYHSSQTNPAEFAERARAVRSAADAAGRPSPTFSARVRTHLGPRDTVPEQQFGPQVRGGYTMAGNPDELIAEVRRWTEAGVDELVLAFDARQPDVLIPTMERFDADVVAAFR
jgi:probable F420-dependent oxidoreductase